MRGKRYNGEKQAVGGQIPGSSVDQNDPPIPTADRLATEYKVSPATITHEVVAQLTRWWDDEVFEKYPSWDECEGSAFFSRPLLTQYFGATDENGGGGAGAYLKCVQYGIGREVLAKMLEGTETKSAIEQALAVLNLVPTGLRFETTVPPAHARAQHI